MNIRVQDVGCSLQRKGVCSMSDKYRREGKGCSSGREVLTEPELKDLISNYGIQVPKGRVVAGVEEATDAFAVLSPPLVVKVVSGELTHKTDAGGVILNIDSLVDLRHAIAKIGRSMDDAGIAPSGYLVEEQCPRAHELVVGGVRNPDVGPVIMLGLGGVLVDILHDIALRLCPIDTVDAHAMIDELSGTDILDGARGGVIASRQAIVDLLIQVGGPEGLLLDRPDIVEFDLNPVIVSERSAIVVDAVGFVGECIPERQRDANSPGTSKINFAALFAPASVAVVGASATAPNVGNNFIDNLVAFGFSGAIYPIHPTADFVGGLKAYPSLVEAPSNIDYAYITIPAGRVPDVLAGANGRVAFAQVVSSGFSETSTGKDLERELIASARRGGVRVIGPNSLGTYSPRGHLTFADQTSKEAGGVGIISQSGGLSIDILRYGARRGVKFSEVVSVGNASDINANDIIEYYLHDLDTSVIGIYLESLKDGRRLFELIRAASATKPVVVLKGGRTSQGQRAANSHTGGLAVDERVWAGFTKQAGCVAVDTLDEFLDTLLAFQTLKNWHTHVTQDVVLFGNGGGTSVLAADAFARAGLRIELLPPATVEALRLLDLPAGTSFTNPIDAPAPALAAKDGGVAVSVLRTVLQSPTPPDAIVTHLNIGVILSNSGNGGTVLERLVQTVMGAKETYPESHHVLVLRSDGHPDVERVMQGYRELAVRAGVPVYSELTNAASALKAVSMYEGYLGRRQSEHARGEVIAMADVDSSVEV